MSELNSNSKTPIAPLPPFSPLTVATPSSPYRQPSNTTMTEGAPVTSQSKKMQESNPPIDMKLEINTQAQPNFDTKVQTPQSTTSQSVSSKSKVSTVIGDGSFESIMKARAQKRKEKDEHCVAELRVAMTNMDRSLTQEIKRRIEGNKMFENKAREEILSMEERMMSMLEEKVGIFRDSLQLLEDKVKELNDRLEEEKERIPKDIEERGAELKSMLLGFQNEFSVERRDRLTREGRIMKQLTDHAQDLTGLWENESGERQNDSYELRTRLEHHENNRAKADNDFESLISSELQALKMELQKETMERKVEDDEIVEALNRYTANLQKSLSMLD